MSISGLSNNILYSFGVKLTKLLRHKFITYIHKDHATIPRKRGWSEPWILERPQRSHLYWGEDEIFGILMTGCPEYRKPLTTKYCKAEMQLVSFYSRPKLAQAGQTHKL